MAQKEKQVLQKGKSYVTIVGKASIGDNSFSGEKVSSASGYVYKRVNIGVETSQGNKIYGEMMGGYAPSNPLPIKARTKPVDGQQENVDIDWADRLNDSIVDTVNDYNLIKVGLIRENEPAEGQEPTEEQANSKLIVKKFLSPFDAHDYIQENLKDGMMIMIKGKYAFSTYKDETQRKIEIESIFLSKSEEGFANFVQTVILDEDSLTKEALKNAQETGEIVINARAVDYVSKLNGKKVGKNMLFDLPIVVKIDKDEPEKTQTIVQKLFKVKKGKIRELGVEGQIIEGYEQEEVNEKDIELSKDVKELIEMGLYSMEEAKKKMTVRGNRVSKLVFSRPFINRDKDDANKISLDMNDDKYTPEDLIVHVEEDTDSSVAESIVEETSNANGDTSWLQGLL